MSVPIMPWSFVVEGAQIVPSKIDWTDAELRGWDSYCPTVHAPYCPPLTTWSSLEAKENFRRVLMTQMIDNDYKDYKTYHSTTRINLMAKTTIDGSFSLAEMMNTISWALCESYVNNYRTKIDPKAIGFDMSQVPWLSLPNVATAVKWLMDYLDVFYAKQILDFNAQQTDPSQNPSTISLYGYFKFTSAPVVARDPSWKVYLFVMLHCHYAHLMTSDRLILSRKHIRALYTSLRHNNLNYWPEDGTHTTMAQYMNNVVGTMLCTSFLLQSQSILLKQGIRVPDTFMDLTAPDWKKGEWTAKEALEYAEYMVTRLVTQMTTTGTMEFGGSYTHWHTNLLGMAMSHACSARAFALMEKLWIQVWTDNISNYLAEAGCMSGPTARCYNLYDIQHQLWDRLDAQLFINSLLRPNRTTTTGSLVTDQSIPLLKYIDPLVIHWDSVRDDFNMRLLGGGVGFLPETLVDSILIKMQNRVTIQKHGTGRGQIRYNYLTPDFSIGNSGVGINELSISSNIVARFSPTLRDPASNQSNSIFRLMLENNDNPFSTGSDSRVPGNGVQLHPRLVSVQDKHLLLITSLAFSPSTPEKCLNSDMFAPLNVDSIEWISNKNQKSISLQFKTGPNDLIQTILPSGPDNLLIVTRDKKTFVGKLLIFDVDSDVPIEPTNARSQSFAVNSGREPCALMWQVGKDERTSGVGRFIVHHRNTGSPASVKAYRVAWLWSMWSSNALVAGNEPKQVAIDLIQSAKVAILYPVLDKWDYKTPLGTMKWGVSVSLSGIEFSVDRTDLYEPKWNNPSVYEKIDSQVQQPPIATKFEKRVNGIDVDKIHASQTVMSINSVAL